MKNESRKQYHSQPIPDGYHDILTATSYQFNDMVLEPYRISYLRNSANTNSTFVTR